MRIEVTYQEGSSYTPWRWRSTQQRSGQGLVVGNNLVLVLASLVLNATHVEGRLNTEPSPTSLSVHHLDLDRGIALLKGKLPEVSQSFSLPQSSSLNKGADVVMYWKTDQGRFMEGHGTLDRMESSAAQNSYQKQTYYQASNVSVRGGYGEPVFCNEKLIGFGARVSGSSELSILPIEMVHLRYELPSGTVRPDTAMSGIVTRPCLQKYLRNMKGLGDHKGGCWVSTVHEQGSGSRQLKKGDILLRFNDKELDAWGRYKDPLWGSLDWEVLLGKLPLGGAAILHILREGKPLDLNIHLSTIDEQKWLIPAYRLGQRPQYFVRGGFVFQDLSMSYVKAWGVDWKKKAPDSILRILENKTGKIKGDQQEIVLLSKVLSHPVNRGFQHMGREVINRINGVPLLSLRQLKEVMDNSDGLIELSLGDDDLPLMMNPHALKSADEDIKKWYQVHQMSHLRTTSSPGDSSHDLIPTNPPHPSLPKDT
jgi:hypothetical protein